MRYKYLLLSITFILFSFTSFSTIYTSTGTGGAWGAAGTWLPAGGPPACGDTIYITANTTVTIESQQDYSACGSPMFVVLDSLGTLDFNTAGQKLRLPCGSGVTIEDGGLLTSTGGGGGATNQLEICGTEVWRKSDGDVNGPFTFGTPLPIVLISFTAEVDKTSVKLEWITESELNNDFFTIERSANALDFEVLGQVPGAGNSNTIREYDYFDDAPLVGTSYYRLKQTDYDGKYEYSGLIAVNYNQDEEGICILSVYPNPCVGTCTINLEDCPLADNQVEVELYDTMGKKIVNRITPKNRDQDISFHLNANNNLSPGIYIVKSSASGKSQSSKVIVK